MDHNRLQPGDLIVRQHKPGLARHLVLGVEGLIVDQVGLALGGYLAVGVVAVQSAVARGRGVEMGRVATPESSRADRGSNVRRCDVAAQRPI